MLPTQIHGTVAFLGIHNQTQVHDQHYPATSWNANLTSHPTAWLAVYDNRRNAGVSLLNPCSTAASQGLGGVQMYIRQARWMTAEKVSTRVASIVRHH